MKLAQWLTWNGFNDADFGAIIGVSRPYVYRLKTGKRDPSLRMMRKIFAATNGLVAPEDFLYDQGRRLCEEISGLKNASSDG